MTNQKNLRRKKAKKRERRKSLFSMKRTRGNHHQETGIIVLTKLSVNNLLKTNFYTWCLMCSDSSLKQKRVHQHIEFIMHNSAAVKINKVLKFVLAMHKYKLIFPTSIVYFTFKRRNCYSLRDVDIAKYPNRGVSILF